MRNVQRHCFRVYIETLSPSAFTHLVSLPTEVFPDTETLKNCVQALCRMSESLDRLPATIESVSTVRAVTSVCDVLFLMQGRMTIVRNAE
jgi:hypothetical protein